MRVLLPLDMEGCLHTSLSAYSVLTGDMGRRSPAFSPPPLGGWLLGGKEHSTGFLVLQVSAGSAQEMDGVTPQMDSPVLG